MTLALSRLSPSGDALMRCACAAAPGAGELAQLLLAHRFHHLARGALEACLRALAALGRERRARGHLLLLRSGRHEILLATGLRSTSESGFCA
jgi:hypothetical protein